MIIFEPRLIYMCILIKKNVNTPDIKYYIISKLFNLRFMKMTMKHANIQMCSISDTVLYQRYHLIFRFQTRKFRMQTKVTQTFK